MIEHERPALTPIVSLVLILLSAAFAVVFATGLLTIALSLAALINGSNVVEYYEYVFPRFRGGSPAVHIPTFGYVIFVAYVGLAASVAIRARRRIAEAWSRGHTA